MLHLQCYCTKYHRLTRRKMKFSTRSLLFCICMIVLSTCVNSFRSFAVQPSIASRATRKFAAMNEMVPSNIICDIIQSSIGDAPQCGVDESKDFGALLSSHKKAVLFAVPGAFTPTCSVSHLPGFIANAAAMRAKGVDAIYCLSVNDRFVMKCWGEATAGFSTSGVQLVADGSCEFTKALNLVKDATAGRMGLRSMRYAMIIESGKIVSINVDEKGLEKSSAENILSLL